VPVAEQSACSAWLTVPSALLSALRRRIATDATTLRDAARDAPVPLPVAAAAASLCTLILAIVRAWPADSHDRGRFS
jgi:hypothetical protein